MSKGRVIIMEIEDEIKLSDNADISTSQNDSEQIELDDTCELVVKNVKTGETEVIK